MNRYSPQQRSIPWRSGIAASALIGVAAMGLLSGCGGRMTIEPVREHEMGDPGFMPEQRLRPAREEVAAPERAPDQPPSGEAVSRQ